MPKKCLMLFDPVTQEWRHNLDPLKRANKEQDVYF